MDIVPKPAPRGPHLLWGLLALIPATVLLVTGYLVPTVRTWFTSFTDADMLSRPAESVGWDNYGDVFDHFAGSLPGPVLLAVAVTATALVGGGLTAWLAARAGRWGRWAARAAFALPMAAAGAAMGSVAWLLALESPMDLNPFVAQYAAFAGLAVGLAVTAYLLVFRRSTRLRDTWPGALLVSGVIAATALAFALQSFAFPYLLRTPGGPRFRSPAMLVFETAFQYLELGAASAGAALLLVPLAVLGVGVTVWLIAARARLVPADQPTAPADQLGLADQPGLDGSAGATTLGPATEQPTPPADQPGPPAGHVVARPAGGSPWLVVSLLVTGVGALLALAGLVPWLLSSVSFSTEAMASGPLAHLVSTWIPPLLSTLAGVSAAALAGYGIGALRPLGDRSELLLLPFAPWLFVGLPALTPDAFAHRMEDGSEFLFLVPPASLSIPVLVGSALLFRGVRWTRALPVVGLAALMAWIVAAQDAWWPLIAGIRPDTAPMQVVVLNAVQAFGFDRGVPTGWLYPLPVLLIVAAAITTVQLLTLDRLTLRTGRPDS